MMWNQKGSQCLLVLTSLKVLVMMNSLHNIVISVAQRLLMLMGSKVLIKMTRPQNIKIKNSVLWPDHLYQKYDPINIRRPWAPEITMFCSEFIMTKTFKSIKTRRHWPPIWFHIFFSKVCFSSWPPLFTPGVYSIRLHFFFDPLGLGLDSSMTGPPIL